MPVTKWSDHALAGLLLDSGLAQNERYLAYRREQAPAFFFVPAQRPRFRAFFHSWDEHPESRVTALTRAGELAAGALGYFGHLRIQTGFPPDWHRNPITGQRTPADRHWSTIDDFRYGDIKAIWEASRFGFVFDLVRAYWRTGDECYAALFWRAVWDWGEHNPPQAGVNWKCGQEISFRVMAWCFGLYGFLDSPETTAARAAMLTQMIAVSGQRIEGNLAYALSQQNNHGISEAAGLWTIGILFPELKAATRWQERGRKILEDQCRKLIYGDGSFSQHSVNYHRLMLQDYLWAVRLGDLNGRPLSEELRKRIGLAADFLYQMQDEISGKVPCYGQNDSTMVLPLNNCDYHDFRPVIQSVHFLCKSARKYPAGPWDEDLLWLFGLDALEAPLEEAPHADFVAPEGGYYVLRAPLGFVLTRCTRFRHRPSQADMLHVDVWWRGQNIAVDAGTYSYNAPYPWNNPLAGTAYHNTITVDGRDQMDRVGHFLWLPWAKGKIRSRKVLKNGNLSYLECEHDGYCRLRAPASHRRGILYVGEDIWLVLDRLSSRCDHMYRLHWLLQDFPYMWHKKDGRLRLETTAGAFSVQVSGEPKPSYSLVRSDQKTARGWRAPNYQQREPAISLAAEVEGPAALFWTVFSPIPGKIFLENGKLVLDFHFGAIEVTLRPVAKGAMITQAVRAGCSPDRLTLDQQ